MIEGHMAQTQFAKRHALVMSNLSVWTMTIIFTLCTHTNAGTIEERILKLQDKKQLVFEGTVGRDAEALTRLTEDDLRFLFS
jgi:phosphatidylglycerophosphatase A